MPSSDATRAIPTLTPTACPSAGGAGAADDRSAALAAGAAALLSSNAPELVRALVEGSTDAIYVKDPDGRYLTINTAGARLLGRRPDEVIGRDDGELFTPEAAAQIRATDREILATGAPQTTERTSTVRPPAGAASAADAERWQRTFLTTKWVHRDADGRPVGIIGVARDVTEHRVAEVALRDAERRARATAERMRAVAIAAAGVIGADSIAALQEVLAAACRSVMPFDVFTFGLYDAESDSLHFAGNSWFSIEPTTVPLAGLSCERVVRQRRSMLTRTAQEEGGHAGDTVALVSGDLPARYPASAIRSPILSGDAALGMLSVQSYTPGRYDEKDVEVLEAIAALAATALRNIRLLGDLRRSEAELTFRAFHDPLTGLPNRALFLDRVTHALGRAKRDGHRPAVLFLDLDNFKTVNDSLGHAEGDRLLVLAAERLRSCIREGDTIARLGGDEFAVLLEDADGVLEAERVAERIIAAFAIPFELGGTAVLAGASVGIAVASRGAPPEALLRDADVAMYSAKSRGKGCYAIFEPAMHAAVLLRLQLESDLRRAVEREEFILHYQPIVRLASGEIVGVEALVRWHHPERGLIRPMDFIAVAEDTGLIVQVGQWVLREACTQAAAWRRMLPDDAPFTITVNVSGRQAHDPAVTYAVQSALAESGLPPERLILEITESVLMQNSDATLRKLQVLRDLGLSLALDDFGTGYSSLAYLQRFPLDILKIDKIFVDALGSGTKTSGLARAILLLGQTLGLKTIAEGIESPAQRAQLRVLGCELGQGFHFARPLPADEITDILQRRRCLGEDEW